VVIKSFRRFGEQPTGSVEGVTFPAPVAEELLLDAPAALVELEGGVFDHMERVGHLDGVRHRGVEDRLVGAGQVQGGEADVGQPLCAPTFQPASGPFGLLAFHDVEQLAPFDIDQLGGEGGGPIGAEADEQHLIEPEGVHLAEAIGVSQESASVGHDRVVDGVPVAPEGDGHFIDAAAIAADLLGDPPTRPIGEGQPGCCDRVVLFGPAPRQTLRLEALPPALQPHDNERAQSLATVDQGHRAASLRRRDDATRWTPGDGRSRFNGDSHRRAVFFDRHDVHVAQSNEDLAHARRVRAHGGSPVFRR
jgi:hypothetical protein